MNAQAPRGLLARYGIVLAALVAVLALASCASPLSSGSSNHGCADTVAKAFASDTTVAGTWDCFSPDLQAALSAYGFEGDEAMHGIFPAPPPPKLVGEYADTTNAVGDEVYAYAIPVQDQYGSTFTVVLVLWVNGVGKVYNIGDAEPIL